MNPWNDPVRPSGTGGRLYWKSGVRHVSGVTEKSIEDFDGRLGAWHDGAVLARWSILLSIVAAACSAVAQVQPMPDFQLSDENPNSPRYHQTVSPRDYRLQIAAFYFGDAG
ncbi:MAG: hypothetical protein IT581_01535 [Verrucomicrobiales bacterium]|nr:hypothetical protein [Verrucomicrobiales bacterium]